MNEIVSLRPSAKTGARRKKTYYGVSIGILMVNSRFQRFVGDIGHAGTWDFPVQYRIVKDAIPAKMTQLHDVDLLAGFKEAALELVDAGVDGITTTCGFLSIYQKELAEFCPVPVATSALLQVPMAERLIPAKKRVGILTYAAASLNGRYFEGVGVDPSTPVVGMPTDSEFVRSIRDGDDTVPFETLREEVLEAAATLMREHPDTGAIVSECTNLTPYSADIAQRFGVPVFDAVTLVNWFRAGLRPRRFVQD